MGDDFMKSLQLLSRNLLIQSHNSFIVYKLKLELKQRTLKIILRCLAVAMENGVNNWWVI